MKIDIPLRIIRSISGLQIYFEGMPSELITIETLKYGRLYWVTLGTDTDNLFITIDFNSDKPHVNVTERSTDNGDDQSKYYLGRSIDLTVTNRGKAEFVQAVYNKDIY